MGKQKSRGCCNRFDWLSMFFVLAFISSLVCAIGSYALWWGSGVGGSRPCPMRTYGYDDTLFSFLKSAPSPSCWSGFVKNIDAWRSPLDVVGLYGCALAMAASLVAIFCTYCRLNTGVVIMCSILCVAMLAQLAPLLVKREGDLRNIKHELHQSLNSSLTKAKMHTSYRDQWNLIQIERCCCGLESYTDWTLHGDLPWTCGCVIKHEGYSWGHCLAMNGKTDDHRSTWCQGEALNINGRSCWSEIEDDVRNNYWRMHKLMVMLHIVAVSVQGLAIVMCIVFMCMRSVVRRVSVRDRHTPTTPVQRSQEWRDDVALLSDVRGPDGQLPSPVTPINHDLINLWEET